MTGTPQRPDLPPDRPSDLHRALDLASADVPVPDGLAETTWLRGRRVRRRERWARATGGLGLVAAVALTWAVVAGPLAPGDDLGVGPAAPSTALEGVERVPVTASPATQEVWAALRSACLAEEGYTVRGTGSTLSVTRPGAQPGDYTRDTARCDDELAMRLPPVDVLPDESGALRPPASEALGALYARYRVAAACVEAQGLPLDPAPPQAEFVEAFAREWMPSWHPWTAAARDGHYAQARTDCPIGAG